MVRFKNRYIVVEMKTAVPDCRVFDVLYVDMLKTVITSKVAQMHGDFGVAAITSGFQLKYCSRQTSILILRARHGPHRILTSTLPFVTQCPKGHLLLNSLYTGATLRQCYKFLLKHQTKNLHGLWAKLSKVDQMKLEASFAKDEARESKTSI